MTQLHMIYVASLIGAVLFFIAGAAAMALRRQPQPQRVEVRIPTLVRDDAALTAAFEREQMLRASEARLQGELERNRREIAAARSAIQTETGREKRLVDELAAARKREAELGDELTAARNREAGLGDELTAARGGELHRRNDLALQLERVRSELTVATRDLDAATSRSGDFERQLGERTRAVRELSTENEHLKGRLRDAEGLRGEYVRLRTAETDGEFLKSEVVRLEAELRTMHVEALGISRPRKARGSVQPRSSSVRTIGESLTTVIDRFSDDGTRSIAVADTMGFPLAASGNDGIALAAYAALLLESATKSRQFLPIGKPAGIELVDEQGTRVSVWTFDVDGDSLLLANVAVTAVETTRVENALAELGAILAPTQLRAAGR